MSAVTHIKALRSLISDKCPACGGIKRKRQSLCYVDYKKLKHPTQLALYRPLGRGYEQALIEALKELGVPVPYWPPEPVKSGDAARA